MSRQSRKRPPLYRKPLFWASLLIVLTAGICMLGWIPTALPWWGWMAIVVICFLYWAQLARENGT